MEAVWPNVFVTENSLVQCISEIRSALGNEGSDILKTVARRGYLLTALVTEVDSARPELSPTAGPPIFPSSAHAGAPTIAPPLRGAPVASRRRALTFAVLVLAGALGGWWWMAAEHTVPEVPLTAETGVPYKRLSIAVLPFVTKRTSRFPKPAGDASMCNRQLEAR